MIGIRKSQKISRCTRGSAILYILIIVLSVAIIVLVAAELGMSSYRLEYRYEDSAYAQRAWDGICAKIDADSAAGSLSVPATYSVSMNGATGTATVVDNSASISNTYKITGTLTVKDGRTYPESTIIAKTASGATPFYYAMFVNSAFSFSTHQFTTGASSANGDIYSNGHMSISTVGPGSANTINGNVQSTGAITLSGPVVTGTQTSNSSKVTFTNPTASKYLAVATATSTSNNLAGYTFGSVSSGSPYPVLYVNAASVNVNGSFSGVGTIYFTGNVTINGSVSYANGSSHVAFIVGGNLTTNGHAFVGYWYVNGSTTASGTTLTDSYGALITNSLTSSANTSLTLDPTVKNSVTTGNLMHLPGYTW